MLDTVGPELQVVNRGEKIISLKGDGLVILTPDKGQEPSSELLPINFDGLSEVWQDLSIYHDIYIFVYNN